jgi:hypothetical protein
MSTAKFGRLLFIPALAAIVLVGCEPEVGSARWCDAMKKQSAADWSLREAGDFARHCVLPTTTVGSKAWCEALEKTPKGDWTAGQITDYAQHCVIGGGDEE